VVAATSTDIRAFPANLHALTSLRAFLALGVVLFHYQLQWDPEDLGFSPLINRARLGVDVFFMLSGFILAHVYSADVAARRFNYRRFLVARLARVYPLHLALLLVMLGIVTAATVFGVSFDRATYTPLGFVQTFLLIHAWFPTGTGINWNGPSWSVSAEWFAYLLFPLYAAVALKLRDRPWLLLLLAVGGFFVIDAGYVATFGKVLPRAEDNLGILRIVPEFLIGMALHAVGRGMAPGRFAAVAFALIAGAVPLVAMQLAADDRLIVILAAPTILAWALLAKAGGEGILAARPMVFAGEVSYALYLVHLPVLIVWKGIVSEGQGIDSSYRPAPLELMGVFLLTVAAAVALHLLVERPARQWVRSRLTRLTG